MHFLVALCVSVCDAQWSSVARNWTPRSACALHKLPSPMLLLHLMQAAPLFPPRAHCSAPHAHRFFLQGLSAGCCPLPVAVSSHNAHPTLLICLLSSPPWLLPRFPMRRVLQRPHFSILVELMMIQHCVASDQPPSCHATDALTSAIVGELTPLCCFPGLTTILSRASLLAFALVPECVVG